MNSNVVVNAEIAKDPKFDEQLQGVINEQKEAYDKLAKEHGAKNLKATPLTNLMKQGKLTVEFLKAEFPKIANKQSGLPSSQRQIVSQIVFNAAQRTVLIKQAERARKIEEKANAKAAEGEAGNQAPEPKPKGSKRKAKKLQKKGRK